MFHRLLPLFVLASLFVFAPAARAGRGGKVGDWITNISHPCHFPLNHKKFKPSQWQLVWADEFNGGSGACFSKPALCAYGPWAGVRDCPAEFQRNLAGLDKCKWSVYHYKNYMFEAFHDFSAEDVKVERGNLVLTSRARPAASVKPVGPGVADCRTSQEWTPNCTLSAGGVEARPYPGQGLPGFQQAYGRWEVRGKLPRTPGSWPAYWMMPNAPGARWPDDGEIDIMESFGGNTKRAGFTLHWKGNGEHQQGGAGCALNTRRDFADDFHVFAVEWEPGEIRWFVDEYQVKKVKSNDKNSHRSKYFLPSMPFFWILNSSITMTGSNGGASVAPGHFPTGTHLIDYVRVYRKK